VDRDGSLAMAVGGVLAQKTGRPIKVLSGGLEAYWTDSVLKRTVRATPPAGAPPVQVIPPPAPAPSAPTAPPAAPPPTPPKKKSAGC
jgi:hypothetical protein